MDFPAGISSAHVRQVFRGAADLTERRLDLHGVAATAFFLDGLTAGKDIAQVLLRPAAEISEETIYAAAAIAAYYSKARSSENVPVDYVPIRLVKKPAGARPGMVIFTGNRTVWVSPRLPE